MAVVLFLLQIRFQPEYQWKTPILHTRMMDGNKHQLIYSRYDDFLSTPYLNQKNQLFRRIAWRNSFKKMDWKIMQNLQKNTCNFNNKRPRYKCFPVNLKSLLKTTILQNTTTRFFKLNKCYSNFKVPLKHLRSLVLFIPKERIRE